MAAGYWRDVVSEGLSVPTDRPLDDLTAELTTMLGATDPELRDGIALPALSTWLERGVYDDLLAALGDGMATGLGVGLGEEYTDTVFRRCASVRVLTQVLRRDTSQRLLTGDQVLRWGDQIATWFLSERDVRGWVPDKGWAHALAHGADAIGALAASPHLSAPELTVLLDVLADRLAASTHQVLIAGEPDRIAAATVAVLRRDLVQVKVFEPWVARVAAHAGTLGAPQAGDPYLRSGTCQGFLRALYLQLALGPAHPADRADQLLVLVEALRATNPHHLC